MNFSFWNADATVEHNFLFTQGFTSFHRKLIIPINSKGDTDYLLHLIVYFFSEHYNHR